MNINALKIRVSNILDSLQDNQYEFVRTISS